jgi:hypothetical protein
MMRGAMKNALCLVALLLGAGCGGSNGSSGGSCGAQACGGDLVGTWKATSACVDEAALSKLVLGSYASCSGTSLSQVKAMPYGVVTFGSDLTYTISLSMDLSFQLNIPRSCFGGGDCSSANNQLIDNLTGTEGVGSVACAGDTACMCNQVGELNFGPSANSQGSSGTYAISGTMVSITSTAGVNESGPFCVQDTSTLHLELGGMSSGTSVIETSLTFSRG